MLVFRNIGLRVLSRNSFHFQELFPLSSPFVHAGNILHHAGRLAFACSEVGIHDEIDGVMPARNIMLGEIGFPFIFVFVFLIIDFGEDMVFLILENFVRNAAFLELVSSARTTGTTLTAAARGFAFSASAFALPFAFSS